MPVPESKKKANISWDKKNMTNLACRVTREKAELFHKACKAAGTNSNAVLLETVNRFIAEYSVKDSSEN